MTTQGIVLATTSHARRSEPNAATNVDDALVDALNDRSSMAPMTLTSRALNIRDHGLPVWYRATLENVDTRWVTASPPLTVRTKRRSASLGMNSAETLYKQSEIAPKHPERVLTPCKDQGLYDGSDKHRA